MKERFIIRYLMVVTTLTLLIMIYLMCAFQIKVKQIETELAQKIEPTLIEQVEIAPGIGYDKENDIIYVIQKEFEGSSNGQSYEAVIKNYGDANNMSFTDTTLQICNKECIVMTRQSTGTTYQMH